jgi:hypothetical protein
LCPLTSGAHRTAADTCRSGTPSTARAGYVGDLTPRIPRSCLRAQAVNAIDEVYDAEAAKNQLGHTSKTVTERHYINRKLVVPDYRAATERLSPGSGAGRVTDPAQ